VIARLPDMSIALASVDEPHIDRSAAIEAKNQSELSEEDFAVMKGQGQY
jgi:hypothetical protein